MATDIFYAEIPLEGKERRRRNRCLVACLCVTGVVVLCIGSNALKCREQCFDETISMP